jgi:hypothetical protein
MERWVKNNQEINKEKFNSVILIKIVLTKLSIVYY